MCLTFLYINSKAVIPESGNPAQKDWIPGQARNEKELPESVDGYREALRKHLMVHNGKFLKEFEKLYKLLHIAGYYRGLLEDVVGVKDALKAAKIFVEKIK